MNRWLFAVLAALILLAPSIPHAEARDWTAAEKGLGVAALTLHMIDLGQTRHIAKSGGVFHELNPVIGRHPSVGRVNGYFLASGLLIASLAHFVPEYRKELLMLYVGVQAANTARNFSIGLRVSF